MSCNALEHPGTVLSFKSLLEFGKTLTMMGKKGERFNAGKWHLPMETSTQITFLLQKV